MSVVDVEAVLAQDLGGSMWIGFLQCSHSVRARRWATTQSMALETRNGSMPISIRRVIAPGASFVCSVERTRWPVSAASMAICAVSRSRISPTMITSGSARIIERRPLAKFRPAFALTWTCVMPPTWYSTGSSIVMMFFSGVLMTPSAA